MGTRRTKAKDAVSKLTEWARTAPPSKYAMRAKFDAHPDAAEAIIAVCALRSKGQQTPSMRALADKLNEVYPGLDCTYLQVRDFVQKRVPGGWHGRV